MLKKIAVPLYPRHCCRYIGPICNTWQYFFLKNIYFHQTLGQISRALLQMYTVPSQRYSTLLRKQRALLRKQRGKNCNTSLPKTLLQVYRAHLQYSAIFFSYTIKQDADANDSHYFPKVTKEWWFWLSFASATSYVICQICFLWGHFFFF